MSILSKKREIFGKIAADKTITEGLPKLKTNSSFPSINNDGNVVSFLTDLIKSLVGFEELLSTIVDTLTHNIGIIEKEIKDALKKELKSIVSCGVSPTLPDYVKSTGSGIKITVDQIDFTHLMRTNPNSDTGKLIYTDLTPNLINSSDFNTFLYQTIQNDGSNEAWPQVIGSQNKILTFQFKSIDVANVDPNNTLTIKAHPSYDNKTLSQLNNDYIDSISLFDGAKLLINLVNSVFGSISNFAKKTLKQIENEEKVNTVIDKIVNSGSKDIISDKYFDFSSKEKQTIELSSKLKKDGQGIINTTNGFYAKISKSSLQQANDNITSFKNDTVKQKESISKSLNDISNQIAGASNNPFNQVQNKSKSQISQVSNNIKSFGLNKVDHKAIKLNFIQQIINNFTKVIVNTILSPKVVSIFIINFKIIYGPNETFGTAVEFMKKNKNLIRNICKRISGIIIKILLKKALKKITELVSKSIITKEIDKNKSNVSQLLSLIGIPQDTIRQLKGLS